MTQFSGITQSIFNIRSLDPSYSTTTTAILIMLGISALKLPANATFAVLIGIQKQPLERLYNGIMVPTAMLMAALFCSLYYPTLLALSVVTSLILLAISLIATVHCHLILTRNAVETDSPDNSQISTSRIFNSGKHYFVAGVAATLLETLTSFSFQVCLALKP